ncbi:hypothetical protein SNE40_015174 [Patella caerulea]
MGYMTFVMFYICCIHQVVGATQCEWTVKQNNTEQKIPCQQYAQRDCEIGSRRKLPVPDTHEESVEKPSSLFALGFQKKSQHGILPGINVSWTPPKSATGLKNTKGFLLRVMKLTIDETPYSICRLFKIKDRSLDPHDKTLVFKYEIFPAPPLSDYSVHLYSLPRSGENLDMAMITYVSTPDYLPDPVNEDDFNSSSRWFTSIQYKTDRPETVEVNFVFTDKFQFSKYDVFLCKEDNVDCEDPYKKARVEKNIYNSEHGEHIFTGVEPGSYVIKVQPFDECFGDRSRCFCFTITDQGRFCDPCQTSETLPFNVKPSNQVAKAAPTQRREGLVTKATPTPRSEGIVTKANTELTREGHVTNENRDIIREGSVTMTTTEKSTKYAVPWTKALPRNDHKDSELMAREMPGSDHKDSELMARETSEYVNHYTIVMAVVVLAIGIGLISTTVAFVIWKKRATSDNTQQDNLLTEQGVNYNSAGAIVDELRKKSILILNAEDHSQHVECVKQFVFFLQDVCHCLPVYPPFCLPEISQLHFKDWMLKTLDQVDYILIINSEAAFKIMKADCKHESYKYHTITSTGHLFKDFVKQVLKESKQMETLERYIQVSFEYTSSSHFILGIPSLHCYKIPQQTSALVEYIHRQATNADPGINPLLAKPLDHFEPGRNLKDAINKAAKYERSHVIWFSERFGQPYGRNFFRYDSGFSSVTEQDSDQDTFTRRQSSSDGRDELGFYPPEDYCGPLESANNVEGQLSGFNGGSSSGQLGHGCESWTGHSSRSITRFSGNSVDDSGKCHVTFISEKLEHFDESEEIGLFQPDEDADTSHCSESEIKSMQFISPSEAANMDDVSLSISAQLRQINENYEKNELHQKVVQCQRKNSLF